jgi:alpha-galactosidase
LKLAPLIAAISLVASSAFADVVRLDQLDVSLISQAWGTPRANKSVEERPLTIAGKVFEHGVGTHADSYLAIDVNGATRFRAKVGADDEVERQGSIEFLVIGDGKVLFRSGKMKTGEAAKEIDVSLAGVKKLVLKVTDADNGVDYDHADWADASFDYQGVAPKAVARVIEPAVILTPRPSSSPRINGAEVFGARPGSPILIYVPVTGEKPVQVTIDNLPAGLSFDTGKRLITGSIDKAGSHKIRVSAKNARGENSEEWRLEIGDTLQLTPPMGWNSWNVWGMAIDDAKVRAAADAFVSSGLIDHGWTFINIDDGWARSGEDPNRHIKDPAMSGAVRDAQGNIRVNDKFPDMKALADYVHSKGLKVGIYSSPGEWTCGMVSGSLGHEANDAASYAAWGIDYLKYDWCSYGRDYDRLRRKDPNATERPLRMAPYALMRDELRKQKRDIVYSLCQYGDNQVWEWGADMDGQLWRTTGDITDTWGSMSGIGFSQDKAAPYAKPGRWNDPDMLVVGHVGWGPNVRPTRLTPDEQYTHMTLWSLLSAPLLIGCDLTKLDPFTLNLLTNDEVIDINQDPLGKQATKVAGTQMQPVYAKPLADGSIAVGLFNREEEAQKIEVKWSDLGLEGTYVVRDVWSQQELGRVEGSYSAEVPWHGAKLLKLTKVRLPN